MTAEMTTAVVVCSRALDRLTAPDYHSFNRLIEALEG
jgi:hypothetical protein